MTGDDYPELLAALDELAEDMEPHEQTTLLYSLIAPLLDRVEREDEPLSDDPVLTTPEAVRGVRAAAAGEPVDIDAVYDQLMTVGLIYSEDQDPALHVISQTAYAAALWLRLLTARDLRWTETEESASEILNEESDSFTFTQVIDLLAWTRSGQVHMFWEDAAADAHYCDLPAATHELRAMLQEVAHARSNRTPAKARALVSARGTFPVTNHSFYLMDTPPYPAPGINPEWFGFANGLIDVQPEIAVITVGIADGKITVTVEAHDSPLPLPLDLADWDEVVETTFTSSHGHLTVAAPAYTFTEPFPELTLSGPGKYRVRVHARGRDLAIDLARSRSDEHYLIQVWPTTDDTEVIHRQRDTYGAGTRRSTRLS